MPRFFFDIHEHESFTRDDVGTEVASRDMIPTEARRFLLDVTRDLGITADSYRVMVSVRADDGLPRIHWTSILLEAAWVEP